jgi:DNA polymerase III delta prime subunit
MSSTTCLVREAEVEMNKLRDFIVTQKIPHILFQGDISGIGQQLVHQFISEIYNQDKNAIKNYVQEINCGHCKGIKFVRDELKFFCKTHINIFKPGGGTFFKSVVLLNADKLTTDAQSALRRCIEIFSHNTRFFIIVEDKFKILKPILSRFCEIYIRKSISLSLKKKQTSTEISKSLSPYNKQRYDYLKQHLTTYSSKHKSNISAINLVELSHKLYEKAYNGLDIMSLIERDDIFSLSELVRAEMLFTSNKLKKECRCEKTFMFIILYLLYYNNECCNQLIESVD